MLVIALSVHSDSSMTKDHKISSFSTKRVLPKIQRKKVTPRALPPDSIETHNTANDKVNTDFSKVTPQSTTGVYSPSAYADDTSHMTSHNSLEDDAVDGDTQLAIDVLRSQSDPSILYHYSSHPHSAHRKSPNAKYSYIYKCCYVNFKLLVIVCQVTEGLVWTMIFIHLAVAVVLVMLLSKLAHLMYSGLNTSRNLQTKWTPSPAQLIPALCPY